MTRTTASTLRSGSATGQGASERSASSLAGATQHALAIAGAPFIKAMIPLMPCPILPSTAYAITAPSSCVSSTGCSHSGTRPNRQRARGRRARRRGSGGGERTSRHGQPCRRICPRAAASARNHTLKFAPEYEAWLIEAMKRGDYDDFWKNSGSSVVDHLAEYKDIPVYHVTGWYDSWVLPSPT